MRGKILNDNSVELRLGKDNGGTKPEEMKLEEEFVHFSKIITIMRVCFLIPSSSLSFGNINKHS
jgi:hypothetical protein